MANKAISKAKIEAIATMCKSFYTDFMPMIKKIKYDFSRLTIQKSDKNMVVQINWQIDQALSLLQQIKKFSDDYGKKE